MSTTTGEYKNDSQNGHHKAKQAIRQTQNGTRKRHKKDKKKTKKRRKKDETNIVNIENIVKNSFVGAVAPAHTPEDLAKFSRFETWILENAPRVAEMNQRFTIGQYILLREKLPMDQVKDLLQRMENYAHLTKKNTSAYLTVINWAKHDFRPLKMPNNDTYTTEQYLKNRERLAEQVRKRAEE